MGCDIHLFVEWRSSADAAWTAGDDWHRVAGVLLSPSSPFLHGSKNYHLFAMLAGVRNPGGIVPIAAPRGRPTDPCPEYREWFEEDGDNHSASWLTLDELLAFDWTQKAGQQTAVVPLLLYARWSPWSHHRLLGPGAWYGELPPSLAVIEPDLANCIVERANRSIAAGDLADDSHCERILIGCAQELVTAQKITLPSGWIEAGIGVRVMTGTPYCTFADAFLSDTIPRLLHLAVTKGSGDFHNVRIVFDFDS